MLSRVLEAKGGGPVTADPLRVAVLGGVPPVLGGGGLETQARRTAEALSARGHEVFFAAREPEPRPFDLLHCFGAEPDTWQWLSHWHRNPAPLVVSPVLVVPPGTAEQIQRLAARTPLKSWGPRMRADVLRRADLVVAQTGHEAHLLHDLGASTMVEIGNGVDRAEIDAAADAPPPTGTPDRPYVLLLGNISARKRQADTVRALSGVPVVLAGGFTGSDAERQDFEAALAGHGDATWLGELTDRPAVLSLVRGARALVHLSEAEGQSLALLEALALGTPVVVSRLPANEELAARHPGHVTFAESIGAVRAALPEADDRPAPAPVQSWDDVAAQLEPHYRRLVAEAP